LELSNLRLERGIKLTPIGGRQARVTCDVSATYTDVKELYFYVNEEYADWLTTDVYDAFLVAAIYPCMYYGEPIEIEGKVTKQLYHNVVNYVMPIIRDYAKFTHKNGFHIVPISVGGFSVAEKCAKLRVGNGFSGGVDSFSTLQDRFFDCDDSDYRIDTLFFFHVGQYGNVKNPLTWERANNRFSITHEFATAIGVDAVMMNTNLFDFYLPEWEYSGGVLIRCASVLVFQRCLKRYYISNAVSYMEHSVLCKHINPDLAEFCDPYIMPLLSPQGLDIVDDGEQYLRSEKVARIAENPFVQRYLNVCVNSSDSHVSATNCGHCSKCLRTLVAIESLGVLDKFSFVFDTESYRRRAFGYKCHIVANYNHNAFDRDNVDFARSHDNALPSRPVAFAYVAVSCLFHLPRFVLSKIKSVVHRVKSKLEFVFSVL